MLAPLDNETIFKKAFTNKIVFTQFVKDIFGVEVEVDKIETEKKYEPKAGFIDLAIDIYAETIDKRFIIEIQRIDYDHNFDRFLYYFLQTITEQQKKSKDYSIKQEVLAVVVLTQPYIVNKKTGEAIQDNVLKLDFDLKNLDGKVINIWGHNLIFLNPNPKYKDPTIPARYEDWLSLIRQSIQKNEKITLNLNNKGIAKVIELIDYEETTPEERRQIKITEGRRVMRIKLEAKGEQKGIKKADKKYAKILKQKDQALEEKDQALEQNKQVLEQNKQVIMNSAKMMKNLGATVEQIQQATGLTAQEIKNL